MTPLPSTYRLSPLPADLLAAARDAHRSHATPDEPPVVRAHGGEPVRCCSRDATQDDPLLLLSYAPALPRPSPYQERGAIYVHADTCAGPARLDRTPEAWHGRPQVLRAYDARGWIHPATTLHDGADPDAALGAVFAAPDVVEVHSRNVTHGCFMFAAVRTA